jgi:F-type H+-transporting ATPase subunit delta
VKPLAVARRYARALADVAGQKDAKNLDRTAREISLAAAVLTGDAQILRFFDDPSIPRESKDASMQTLARKAKLSELSARFLGVLIDNRRTSALPAIDEALRALRDERLGIVQAETTMAVKPSETEVKQLRQALERMTGRQVQLSVTIDPGVLGGARTRVGSQVYDGTLRSQLAALRRRLAQAR